MPIRLRTAAAALVLASTLARTLAQQPATLHLIPIPRTVQPGPLQPIPQGLRVACPSCPTDPADAFTLQDLTQTLAARAIPTTSGSVTITLARAANLPPEMAPEGYTIAPGTNPNSLILTAATSTGLFYAAQTLKQLIEGQGSAAVLHLATVRDWPAMRYRGLHDDLSRGPVPTLAFQKHLIQQLAACKVNIYSPYFEHTQQYASNPLPAPPGGSISASDAHELSAFAASYHITIIPEQEAFGHLRHSLIWEQYQPLAETPHGAVLTPNSPGSLPLIKQWFTELADLYPGPFLHIGADETIDLGVGATKSDVDARTLPVVYLDFLQKIVAALQPLRKKILFWGDIAQGSPALLKALPQFFKNQTIAVAWGYSPDPKGFARIMKPYTDAGIEVWAAPSINNYRQVYPNQALALEDIQQFTRDAQRYGATGQLNTLWNDDGESLADQNWYGILFGAAAAWQPGESSIPAFQSSFAQAFHGDSTGLLNQAQLELTAAMALLHDTKVISATEGTDGLFWVDPWTKDGATFATRMRPISSDVRLHAERALTLIAQARAANPARFPIELQENISVPSEDAKNSVAPGLASKTWVSQQTSALRYAAPANPANAYPSPPTSLREPNAIDAMELGARRIDFLALKFQLSDEILSAYARAYAASISADPKLKKTISRELSDINGVNGRMQDLIDGYAQLRDLYAQAWLRTNRPANLRPILQHYDQLATLWQTRADRIRTAQRQYSDTHTLPPAADLGLPH